jgi:hypothetical protein
VTTKLNIFTDDVVFSASSAVIEKVYVPVVLYSTFPTIVPSCFNYSPAGNTPQVKEYLIYEYGRD